MVYKWAGLPAGKARGMSRALERAAAVLCGEALERELALELAQLPGEEVLELAALANRVRNRWAPSFQACSILNIRSGGCSENCRFCAQSGAHATDAADYPLLEAEAILQAVAAAHASGVRSFCLVASGHGVRKPTPDFDRILDAIDQIHARWPEMGVSASLGVLSRETAALLAARRLDHYNINLQTAPERYHELIATTHAVTERQETIRLMKSQKVLVCSGGILGVGETMADRISLALALRDLNVDIIPLNVLVPIPGTPLEHQPVLPVVEVVRTVALFRLLNPRAVIKLAAGRETVMNDFQGLILLAGANGFITGGYLTTRGRDVERDRVLLRHLQGFAPQEAAASA
jgi:biotin synthase